MSYSRDIMRHISFWRSILQLGNALDMTALTSKYEPMYHFTIKDYQWLYIDLDSFFASVEQHLNPDLRGRPVAVVPVETDFTSAIAASYEAKAYGVHTGTKIYEAKRLCPDLVCVNARHDRYVKFHKIVLSIIESCVHVSSVCSIDEFACQLQKNECSFAASMNLAQSIKDQIKTQIGESIRCSIGIAPNKYLAKVVGKIEKPNGLTLVTTENLYAVLNSLLLKDLPGVGKKNENRLMQAGVYSVQDLLNTSPQQIRRILRNIWGEKLWYLMHGADLTEKSSTKQSIGHSHVLSPDLRQRESAYLVARSLTLKAVARLRQMNYHAQSFELSLRTVKGDCFYSKFPCYRAKDSTTFLQLLKQAWNDLAEKIQECAFKKVSITLSELIEDRTVQKDMFYRFYEQENRAKNERLSSAIDRITNRYGKRLIFWGEEMSIKRALPQPKIAFTRIPDQKEFLE